MSLTGTRIIVLVVLCSLFYYGVCRAPSFEQIPVKSIKTKNGQVYNCIPSHIAELQDGSQSKFGLEESCPLGTVPTLTSVHTSIQPQWNPFALPKHHCKAIVRTRADDSKMFLGTRAAIAVYKPKVDDTQWSSSRMKLSNGPESIEAGLLVNHAIFNDYEAHLYVKFGVNGKECINTQCPGFVQVPSKAVLGVIPAAYSQKYGASYVWDISIKKHQDDGNWWVSIYTAGVEAQVGYWPKSLFLSLSEVAAQVEWGGETDNPWVKEPQPEMGSNVAIDDMKVSAFLKNVTVGDINYQYASPTDTEKERDCLPFYTSYDDGDTHYYGRVMYFGGGDIKKGSE